MTYSADPDWTSLIAGAAPVDGMHARLTALIATRCGPQAAAILGRPVEGAPDGWTSASGAPLRLPRDDAERTRLAGQLADAVAEIETLADTLDDQGDAGRLAARSLRMALVTPEGTDALRTDGTGPVLIRWGRAAPGQTLPETIAILAPTPEPEPEPSAPTPSPQRRSPALAALWTLPAALALILGWLAWTAATPLPVEVVEITPPAPDAPDPTTGLDTRLAVLDRALTETEAALPRFAEACTEPPKSEPAKTLEEAIASGDIAQMEGCWKQASAHLQNGRDTGIENIRFCFDAAGVGSVRYEQTRGFYRGHACSEQMRVRFEGDRLLMSFEPQICTKAGRRVETGNHSRNGYCRVVGQSAECRGEGTGVSFSLVR